MKPYKRIFTEDQVVDNQEANKIVDISGLIWGDNPPLNQKVSWQFAINKTPSGWRLPTVQEFYTARIKNVLMPDFKKGKYVHPDSYWTSSETEEYGNAAWVVDTSHGFSTPTYKSGKYYVMYVKDK